MLIILKKRMNQLKHNHNVIVLKMENGRGYHDLY